MDVFFISFLELNFNNNNNNNIITMIIIIIIIIIIIMFNAYIVLFTSKYDQKSITVIK